MAKKRGVTEIDVTGGTIDDRGRYVNKDIPEEARRSGKSKSNAKKRLKQKQDQANKRKREIVEEEESKKVGSKKKRKKVEDDPYSLDPKKEKERKKKKAKVKAKSKGKTDEAEPKKKRKKKTVGELLSEGKTDKARKKMERLASKSMVIATKADVEVEHEHIPSDGHLVQSSLNSEAEFLQEYYHIYGTLGSIIRNLEQRMTEPGSSVNSKDVYALMTMYSQMRETIADLRSIKDMNAQAEELAQHVFDPAAKSAGEALVNLYFKVSSSIRQKVNDPKVVEALTETLKMDVADQASKLQEQFDVARNRIVDVLNGG